MKTVHLREAEVQLSKLIDAVMSGEKVVIVRAGKPVAKLTCLAEPGQRELGFYPIAFQSDLLEPTDDEILTDFL